MVRGYSLCLSLYAWPHAYVVVSVAARVCICDFCFSACLPLSTYLRSADKSEFSAAYLHNLRFMGINPTPIVEILKQYILYLRQIDVLH